MPPSTHVPAFPETSLCSMYSVLGADLAVVVTCCFQVSWLSHRKAEKLGQPDHLEAVRAHRELGRSTHAHHHRKETQTNAIVKDNSVVHKIKGFSKVYRSNT